MADDKEYEVLSMDPSPGEQVEEVADESLTPEPQDPEFPNGIELGERGRYGFVG